MIGKCYCKSRCFSGGGGKTMSYSHIFQELPISPTVTIQKTSIAVCRCLPTNTRTLCVWLKDDDEDNEYGKFYVTKFKSLFLFSRQNVSFSTWMYKDSRKDSN